MHTCVCGVRAWRACVVCVCGVRGEEGVGGGAVRGVPNCAIVVKHRAAAHRSGRRLCKVHGAAINRDVVCDPATHHHHAALRSSHGGHATAPSKGPVVRDGALRQGGGRVCFHGNRPAQPRCCGAHTPSTIHQSTHDPSHQPRPSATYNDVSGCTRTPPHHHHTHTHTPTPVAKHARK